MAVDRRNFLKVAGPAGAIIATSPGTSSAAQLWGRTSNEISAGVTPVNYEYEPGNVLRYGNNTNPGSTDMTATIQGALNSSDGGVFAPDGKYLINGTLVVPAGITLYGNISASEYYPGEAADAKDGVVLLKDSGSMDGPIVRMTTGSGVRNVYLKHEKSNGATSGIIQMGATGTSVTCYNTTLDNVRIYGELTGDIDGTTTCYGILYPRSISEAQRYFNRGSNLFITNCDVAIHLDEESNANNYTGVITRQCYVHYELDGNTNTACVDNCFTGLTIINIGVLVLPEPGTDHWCFRLRNGAIYNTFVGYQTEANGAAFSIDSTSNLNMFIGQENELISTFAPVGGIKGPVSGNIHSRWQRPINNEQYTQMIVPSLSTGSRYETGLIGTKSEMFQEVDGSGDGLPALDGTGTLVTATAHSRVICQMNRSVFREGVAPELPLQDDDICSGSGYLRAGNDHGRIHLYMYEYFK